MERKPHERSKGPHPYVLYTQCGERRKIGRANSFLGFLELWTLQVGTSPQPSPINIDFTYPPPTHTQSYGWRALKPLAQTYNLVLRLTAQL